MSETDLEYCKKCDDPTGNAGEGDGSLFLDYKGPYCVDCYNTEIHEAYEALKAENKNLSGDIATMLIKIGQMNRENERYRKALEEIKSESEFGDKTDIQRVFELSEEALQQSKEGGDHD